MLSFGAAPSCMHALHLRSIVTRQVTSTTHPIQMHIPHIIFAKLSQSVPAMIAVVAAHAVAGD